MQVQLVLGSPLLLPLTVTALPLFMLHPWCLHPCPKLRRLESATLLFFYPVASGVGDCDPSAAYWSPSSGSPPPRTDQRHSAEPFLSRWERGTAWPCLGDGREPSGSDMVRKVIRQQCGLGAQPAFLAYLMFEMGTLCLGTWKRRAADVPVDV